MSNLNKQLGFFMSEEKEPNFFSNDEVYAKGLGWYASLFANADPGDLCGESSTHYTKLPTYPHTVARMRAALPQVKLIYMMRHPIDRLISHYLHEQFEWRMQMPIEEAINKHPELISYGCYSMQLEPFRDAYGSREHPLDLLRAVRAARGRRNWSESAGSWAPEDSLGGSKTWKLPTSAASGCARARFEMRSSMHHVLRTIRKRLVPKSWREQAKRLWQIRQRPQLSNSSVQRLEEAFDADLSQAGTLAEHRTVLSVLP